MSIFKKLFVRKSKVRVLTETIFIGQGRPVDAIDEACRRWHQCRACTKIDNGCDPGDSVYFPQTIEDFRLAHVEDPLHRGCSSNPNTQECCHATGCDFRNCLCDEELAYQLNHGILVGLLNEQFVTNPDGSGYDYVNKCANGDSGDGNLDSNGNIGGVPFLAMWEFKCCGLNPHRYPYKTDINTCCADTDIVPVGVC